MEEFNLYADINYRMMETQEMISKLSLRREKSTFLPTVSAFYRYQDKTNKADFDFTFNNVMGVSVKVPILSSGQKMAKVSQAKIELEQAKNSKDKISETLLMAVDQARYDYKNAFDTYMTEQANVKLTKKIYDKTVFKYKQGMASSMDVSQANNQYLDGNRAYAMAIMDLLNSKVELEKALNKL